MSVARAPRKRSVPAFLSWATVDRRPADSLLARLRPHLGSSARYTYDVWRNDGILVGANWDAEIHEAMKACQVGLLLLSPGFLASEYIRTVELSALWRQHKLMIPVQLAPLDFDRHALNDLDRLQIYAHRIGNERRAFTQCRGEQRDAFVLGLFQAIEQRLDRDL